MTKVLTLQNDPDARRFLHHVHLTPFFALQVIRVLSERLHEINEHLAKGVGVDAPPAALEAG